MIRIHNVTIVPGYPAVTDSEGEKVVIADLHLGYEEAMAEQGVLLPRIQYKKAVKLIEELKRRTHASVLIINGDIKNSFDRLTPQERIEIIKFLSKAKEIFSQVILVRGNHDNYVPLITERMDVELVESYRLSSDTLVIHGHREVEALDMYKLVIIGHEHPSISLRDSLGTIARMPCFLRVPTDLGNEVLVLPAAGYYQTGNSVTLSREDYLSPIIRKHGIIEEIVPIIVDYDSGSLFEFPPLGVLSRAMTDNSIASMNAHT